MFSPDPLDSPPPPQPLQPPFPNGKLSPEAEEEALEESYYYSFHSNEGGVSQLHNEGDSSLFEGNSYLNGGGGGGGGGDGDAACGAVFDFRGAEESHHDTVFTKEASRGGCESVQGRQAEIPDPPPGSGASDSPEECPLVPMMLYLHRVKGLVLALLVEPHFLSDTASMEEVVRNNRNPSLLLHYDIDKFVSINPHLSGTKNKLCDKADVTNSNVYHKNPSTHSYINF